MQSFHQSHRLVCCNCLFCELFGTIPTELCGNPLVVISDNRKTPAEKFHLAPIRTQIPGHKGRQRWVFFDAVAFSKSIYLHSRQSGWLKFAGHAKCMHSINLLWIKI